MGFSVLYKDRKIHKFCERFKYNISLVDLIDKLVF